LVTGLWHGSSLDRAPRLATAAQMLRCKENDRVSANSQDANATQEIGRPIYAADFLRVRDPGGRPLLACAGKPARRRACGQTMLQKKTRGMLVRVLQNNCPAARLRRGSSRSRSAKATAAAASSSNNRQSSAGSGGSLKSGPTSSTSARDRCV